MPRIDEKLSLRIGLAGLARVVDRDGSMVFQMPGNSEQATRTAARIAICWNACKDIPTDVLEAMPKWTNEQVIKLIEAADSIKMAFGGRVLTDQSERDAMVYLWEALKPFHVAGQSPATSKGGDHA